MRPRGRPLGASTRLHGTAEGSRGFYQVLGQRLREARVRMGWSQARLADAVGVARSTVTTIEAGQQTLMPHLLDRWARVLGTSVPTLWPVDPTATADGPRYLTEADWNACE